MALPLINANIQCPCSLLLTYIVQLAKIMKKLKYKLKYHLVFSEICKMSKLLNSKGKDIVLNTFLTVKNENPQDQKSCSEEKWFTLLYNKFCRWDWLSSGASSFDLC